MAMTAKPLNLFNQKLKSIHLTNGASPGLAFFYVPWRHQLGADEIYEFFWKDLCKGNGFLFLDLAPAFNALKTGFYPFEEKCCARHYTAFGGHELIAFILKHELIEKKLIPFEPANDR
jgi:hypothetical protein